MPPKFARGKKQARAPPAPRGSSGYAGSQSQGRSHPHGFPFGGGPSIDPRMFFGGMGGMGGMMGDSDDDEDDFDEEDYDEYDDSDEEGMGGFGFHDFMDMMHNMGGHSDEDYDSDDGNISCLERPQFCHQCGEDFADSDDVKAHIKSAKHFHCKSCMIGFETEAESNAHRENHEKEDPHAPGGLGECVLSQKEEITDFAQEFAPDTGLNTLIPLAIMIHFNYGLEIWEEEIEKVLIRILEQGEINLSHLDWEEAEDEQPNKQTEPWDIMLNPKSPGRMAELYKRLHNACKKAALEQAKTYLDPKSTEKPPEQLIRSNWGQKCVKFLNAGGNIDEVLEKIDLQAIMEWPMRPYIKDVKGELVDKKREAKAQQKAQKNANAHPKPAPAATGPNPFDPKNQKPSSTGNKKKAKKKANKKGKK